MLAAKGFDDLGGVHAFKMTNPLSFRKSNPGDKTAVGSTTTDLAIIGPMKDPFKEAFGRHLRAAAADVGIKTAVKLAEALHKEESAMRNLMNGTSVPNVRDGIALCELLGVDLDYLYRGETAALPGAKRIRLLARLQGNEPPIWAASDEAEEVEAGLSAAPKADSKEAAMVRPRSGKRAANAD